MKSNGATWRVAPLKTHTWPGVSVGVGGFGTAVVGEAVVGKTVVDVIVTGGNVVGTGVAGIVALTGASGAIEKDELAPKLVLAFTSILPS